MASHGRTRLRAACLQVNATQDWRANLRRVRRQMETAIRQGASLIALPENFYWRGPAAELSQVAREVTPPVIREFCETARRYQVAILLGSVVEALRGTGKCANTSVLISESGAVAARYRKLHLFDAALKNVSVRESRHVAAGSRIATGLVQGIRAGLTICYDLRFPELFRRLTFRGCKIIFVPSNFTETTGKVHWEVLLRARAIENQVFIIAPAQVGVHPSNRIRSFGHSLVVNPWGKVIAEGSQRREEVVMADMYLDFQDALRKSFPVLRHRRLKI